ncbi:hypothetical protein [Plectonema phage JingP1]|uniref:Uncharacterized protein n=1 Tax=Plectonema phage JingP1 TaxID=2961687 RepID=A0A9E7NMP2_9CAUD|nr:hypothetical protein [Plectonema phage JingP1]
MPTRPIFSKADIASSNPVTSGNALSAELATQAFPESQQKRKFFDLFPLNKGFTTGATPTELFIDGVQNFRFRVAERSVVTIKAIGVYCPNVDGSMTGFELTVVARNVAGFPLILGTQLQVKYPGASTASIVASVDNATQSLVFTATGIAGDGNGRWAMSIIGVSEVTDIG